MIGWFQTPAPLPPIDPIIPARLQESILMALMIVAVAVAAIVILKPLARAIARRLEGRAFDPVVHAEIEQLREQVAELEPLRTRVQELEERVEFTERMLSQRRDQELLPRAGQER